MELLHTMFKFTNQDGNDVWVNTNKIEMVEHVKQDGGVHSVNIHCVSSMDVYIPTSEEDCRSFLSDLFKSMGLEYKYKG